MFLQHEAFLNSFEIDPNLLIDEDDDEHNDGHSVADAVPCDGVPVQREPTGREEAAHRDDAKDVEDRAAHDGADANVALGHECPHNVGKEFRGAGAWNLINCCNLITC